ncbi:FliH/SctL family protein [Desulfolutivibrio sp.]|uniref:FliH/SctL family protein n=1 Tax=Desulfolutivibrio sp. TaxID=2773296 RepID=UPI002F969629
MSSSNPPGGIASATGRVVMGVGAAGPQETTVAEIEARRTPFPFERMEAEFWERTRTKAQDMAKEIIAQAMTEAERLRVAAREEGLAQGTEQAQTQFETHVAEMSKAFGETLAAIQGDRKTLWDGYRQDFVALVRLALEKSFGILLGDSRQEILASLLDEALDLIDSRTELSVIVHPDDMPMMEELLTRAAHSRQGLERWHVRGDAALLPGGVRLESRDGMVDNTVDSRFAEVSRIFEQLSVRPEADGEAAGDVHGA